MSSVDIPISDTSDIDKNNIKTLATFFKLIHTAVNVDPTFLFSTLNLPFFLDFLKYLMAHFEQNVDKPTKKAIAVILKEMFVDFSGLKANP